MTPFEELLDRLPDDAAVPALIVRNLLKALREQHDAQIEDIIRQTWLLRDLAEVQPDVGEEIH